MWCLYSISRHALLLPVSQGLKTDRQTDARLGSPRETFLRRFSLYVFPSLARLEQVPPGALRVPPHRGAFQYDNQAHWLRHPRGAEYKRPNPEARCDPRPPLVTASPWEGIRYLGFHRSNRQSHAPESGVNRPWQWACGKQETCSLTSALNPVPRGPRQAGLQCGGVPQAINQVMILTIRADHAAPAEEWDGSWSVRYHYAEARLILGHRLPIINTRVTS